MAAGLPADKDFLKSVAIFENYPESALERLRSQSEYCSCGGGRPIFSEGDDAECLYVIASGEVNITKRTSPESELIIAVLGPKSVFGEMSLFAGQPKRIASARAKTWVNYLKISREALRELMAGDMEGTAKTFKSLLLTTFERLERTNQQMTILYELCGLMTRGLSLKPFCQAALDLLCFFVPGVDSGLMYVLQEGAQGYSLCGSVKAPGAPHIIPMDALILRAVGNKVLGGRMEPAIIEEWVVLSQILEGIVPAQGVIALPLAAGRHVTGFVLLLTKEGRVQQEAHMISLLGAVSVQLSNVVNSLRLPGPGP